MAKVLQVEDTACLSESRNATDDKQAGARFARSWMGFGEAVP